MVLVDGVRMNAFGGGMDLSQVSIAGAERVEVVRGPQSALYGSDAIGGVVQVLTSRGGDPMVDALVEGGGRDARRVAGSARGLAGRRLRHAVGAIHGGRRLHRRRAGRRRPRSPTTTAGCRMSRPVSAGARASGTDLFGTFQYLDSDRGSPGPYGSNPAGNFSGVDRNGAQPHAGGGRAALRLIQPLGGAASRVRLRAEADVADFDLEYRDEFGSVGETDPRRTAGCRPTPRFADGLSASAGGEWVGESGRSTYILSGTGRGAGRPRRARPASPRRAGSRRRGSRSPAAPARRASRGRRCLATPTASRRGRPSTTTPSSSVNPKVTAAWIVVPEGGASGASTRLHAAAAPASARRTPSRSRSPTTPG